MPSPLGDQPVAGCSGEIALGQTPAPRLKFRLAGLTFTEAEWRSATKAQILLFRLIHADQQSQPVVANTADDPGNSAHNGG